MHYEDYRYIRPEERSSGRHLWTPHSYLQPPTVLEGWHIIPQSILQHSPNGLALKAPRFLAPIMVPTTVRGCHSQAVPATTLSTQA